ncbi:MarR family transcriptional regulator [Clostridium perfringens]|nr:MarR family transcriptional regulator [Clostridium perfringens]
MDKIKALIKENELTISTLVVFRKAERTIHKKEFITIEEGGLTPTQFGVLEALYTKGDLKICELIEKTSSTSGNITVVIKNLEKEGLIKKNIDPEDKRSCIVSLTDEGRKAIEDILPNHINNIKNIFEVLTEEEKITLKNILKKFKNI